ncbi:MAG: zinc ribbon domain-containing protein [Candidatus Thorarchaeota archaeon]
MINDQNLNVKITQLNVEVQTTISFAFQIKIEIYNPNSVTVTIEQPNWCGFDISLDPKVSVSSFDGSYSGSSICYLNIGKNTIYPIDYKSGYSYESFNGTFSFNLQENQFNDLPKGYYYFDISADTNIERLGALFVYNGNKNSEIFYNISEVYSSYIARPQSYTGSIPTTLNHEQNIFVISIIALIIIFLGMGIVFYLMRNNFLRSKNEKSRKESQKSCPNCGMSIENEDRFCSNCGWKI